MSHTIRKWLTVIDNQITPLVIKWFPFEKRIIQKFMLNWKSHRILNRRKKNFPTQSTVSKDNLVTLSYRGNRYLTFHIIFLQHNFPLNKKNMGITWISIFSTIAAKKIFIFFVNISTSFLLCMRVQCSHKKTCKYNVALNLKLTQHGKNSNVNSLFEKR